MQYMSYKWYSIYCKVKRNRAFHSRDFKIKEEKAPVFLNTINNGSVVWKCPF